MASVLRGSVSRLLTTTNALPVMKAGMQSGPAKNVLTKSELVTGGLLLVVGVGAIPAWVTFNIPKWTSELKK
ncbi:Hypp2760 [Branchiostoma lanceolatum]|uniref:Hypp2760 protein n=1 Tax=Branchiostoma lanceolatum TaxID=7740 RepID=A0A8J9ZZ21_BRALA|nr:Hypp2760 [Branchiostoma lanceolatum]